LEESVEELMPEKEQSLGRIEVSTAAIASIANEAVLTCYGVVETVARDLPAGIVNFLSSESKRGIEVRIVDGHVNVDVHVVIEYGTRVVVVARSIMNVVRYSIERALGIPVAEVNVHVVGLRVSDVD
jgi:uncharacterized alkaline shock family protein YloU